MKRTHLISTLLLMITLILSGCGGGREAAEGAARKPKDYVNGNTTNETIHEASVTSNQGTCETTQLASFEYCVHIEANDAMIASWQNHLFDLLTPAKAYALRGFDNVSIRSLSVVQLSASRNESRSSVIPAHTFSENSDRSYRLKFTSAPPTNRIDIFVKAVLNNGDVLYAPFVIQDINRVTVNVVTDFLVDRLFEEIDGDDNKWRKLRPCTSSQYDYDCPNQAFSKAGIWQGLAALSQNYEFDIPSTLNIEQAKGFLRTRADFTQHTQLVFDTLLGTESPFVDAILRDPEKDGDVVDPNTLFSVSEHYNAVYFGLGMNQGYDSSRNRSAIFSTALSKPALSDTGIGYTYPEFTFTAYNLLSVTHNSISGDIPFQRQFRTQNTLGFSILTPNEINSFKSSLSNTFQHRSGNFLTGKSPYQTITDQSASRGTGWQFDPYVSNVYRVQENPENESDVELDTMLTAPFSRGAVYNLDKISTSIWQRDRLTEEQNLFSYQIMVPSSQAEEFELTTLSGKSYGKVGFTVQLGINDDDARVKTDVSLWSSSSTKISQSQPNDGVSLPWQHYRSLEMNRAVDQAFTPVATQTETSKDLALARLVSVASDITGLKDTYNGRIQVGSHEGAASANGKTIALTFDDNGTRRGVVHAIALRSTTPSLDLESYDLNGHSLKLTADASEGLSYNGSSLAFSGTNQVTLTLRRLRVAHDVSSFTINDPESLEDVTIVGSYSIVRGLIQMQFDNIDDSGDPLTLTGFVSEAPPTKSGSDPGNLMVLSLQHGNNLGLIYATRDQKLSLQ